MCTWYARPKGGSGGYSYEWSGVLSGTESSVTGQVWSSGWLNLEVTAIDDTENASKYITVDAGAPDCV